MQVTHSKNWLKARKRFLIVLIAWLAALPLTVVVQFIVRFILGGSDGGASEVITDIINIFSLLAGMFGILGWIPAIIFGVIWMNEK